MRAAAHPPPEARVLDELGRRDAPDFAQPRRTLELDAGYLGRLEEPGPSRSRAAAGGSPSRRRALDR